MSQQTLILDRDNITKYQKELHFPKNKSVPTRFSLDVEGRSQGFHIKEKLAQVPVKEGEVTYTASKKYDSLLKIEAHVNLIPIRVKEQYKKSVSIRYHHNLGHNILYFGECKLDSDHYGYLDSTWLDIHAQYFVKQRELYDKMVGNLSCLEGDGDEWPTELPGLPLVVPQPYFFSRNSRVSLPILKSASNNITFEYKIRTKLTDLIQMRVLTKEGVYKEIKCNLNYLDTKGYKHIPIPELWGRYAEMTEEERNWRKSVNEETGQPLKQVIYIEDIDITDSPNPTVIGTKEEIALGGSAPAKHIFWTASLVDGGHSNYTTNRYNLYQGWNPCVKSGIKYGTSFRVEEMEHQHFDLSEAYDFNWPNTPREAGYNVHTYTFNPIELQSIDTAVILKECGATLTVLLGDTNPYIIPENEEEYYDEDGEVIPIEILETDDTKKDKYNLHIRTVVMRKLEVYWNDKSESLKYVFTSV